ncbi:MAG: non-heme iron oxygenase ferredoxin subunit [Candidatus Nanopelagicales bacterium]
MTDLRPVALVGDIAPRTALRVFVDGTAIAVVRTDEGIFAIQDRCSHADVSLADGDIDGCAIECWLHGSAFDLRTGLPLSLPATVPVPVYAVEVRGEGEAARILLDPTPVQAASSGPPAFN